MNGQHSGETAPKQDAEMTQTNFSNNAYAGEQHQIHDIRVAIHQPGYLPWLGYLQKVARCDRFVILDDVPANKAAFQYRNTFYCNGTAKFLTLPVEYRHGRLLNQLDFKRHNWREEHLDKLLNYYRKAPAFNEIFPLVERFITTCNGNMPVDVMTASMKFLFDLFDLKQDILTSSSLAKEGHKGELVLSICKTLGAETYVSGKGALEYIDEFVLQGFTNAGISIEWLNFIHPVYIQEKGRPFVAGLSSIDLLFFCGIDASRKLTKEFTR